MSTCGIHLIWTTYMTWPPGDPRGHWSPLFDFYGRLIQEGHQLNLPDPVTVQRATKIAKEPPKILSSAEMDVVADVIGALCPSHSPQHAGGFMSSNAGGFVKIPELEFLAGAIERTHVHLLLKPISMDIGAVVGRIKSATSSAVCFLSESDRHRTWTRGYWNVFLFDDLAVEAVADYIEQHNLRRNLPRAPHSWIHSTK